MLARRGAWTRSSPRSCWPPTGCRSGHCVGAPAADRPTLSRDEQRDRLGLPVFVKPARAGSSLGVTRVTDWADLDAAIATARAHDPKVLVEAAVLGREIECGVLEYPDGRPRRACPRRSGCGGGHDFYDFDAKYLDDVGDFDIPADLPDERTARSRTSPCRGLPRAGLRRGWPGSTSSSGAGRRAW